MKFTLSIEQPSNQILTSLAIGAATIAFVYGSLKFYSRRKRNQIRKNYPSDVVILHQFPHHKNKPSLSTPCLKLETWFRAFGIKYQNEYSYLDRSAQGQLPYVTLNNQDFHDSQFIIEHLSKVYNISDNLNKNEKAIARGFFKLLEESFKWTMYYHRFKFGTASDIGMPSLMFKIFRPKLDKAIKTQGYGRHSPEEVYHIGKQDLQAFEDYLENKKYLFGESISNEDLLLFCFISQIVFYDKGPFNQFLNNNCPNLLRHFTLIKNQYWPEWN